MVKHVIILAIFIMFSMIGNIFALTPEKNINPLANDTFVIVVNRFYRVHFDRHNILDARTQFIAQLNDPAETEDKLNSFLNHYVTRIDFGRRMRALIDETRNNLPPCKFEFFLIIYNIITTCLKCIDCIIHEYLLLHNLSMFI
ncbi:uncharacterized protein LOC111029303 isoform X1 [Myzus persicae]|uniref:uncharacterized protein LOC111029303 isoform X1 n=1 Tax=Myzus persicae TaxID=13164 RepID=UPI000B934CA5|nr:uncharacterized protein LOC111029303 isoform X1 [Myzus persicae]